MPSTTDSTARLGPNRDVNDGGSELSQATRGTEKKTGLSVGAKIGMWVGMNMAIIASANHRTGKALHRMYDQDLASRSGIPNLSTNGNPDPWQLKPFSDGSDFSQCGLIEGVNDPVIGNLTTSMSQASVNNDDRSFQDPKSFVGGYQESESDFDNSGTCDVRDRPSAATGKEVSAKSRGSVE